uniref:Uncharacterized protein n=1 Tax=Lygus hesperus TaxID=30085 RepID=A0A0A9YHJ7_LYGHE
MYGDTVTGVVGGADDFTDTKHHYPSQSHHHNISTIDVDYDDMDYGSDNGSNDEDVGMIYGPMGDDTEEDEDVHYAAANLPLTNKSTSIDDFDVVPSHAGAITTATNLHGTVRALPVLSNHSSSSSSSITSSGQELHTTQVATLSHKSANKHVPLKVGGMKVSHRTAPGGGSSKELPHRTGQNRTATVSTTAGGGTTATTDTSNAVPLTI